MDIEKRTRMAAESILENEAIREGLDDNGASALLDWGTACAMRITQDTIQVEDDEEAQDAVYPRMRALTRMLDVVKELSKSEIDRETGMPLLTQLLEYAVLVYGENMVLPTQIDWDMFISIRCEDEGHVVSALKALIENDNQAQE
jgi:hypothetical protein